MKSAFKTVLALSAVAIAAQATAQVTLYEQEGFQGESFTTRRQIADFARFGFNDRASSVVVAGEGSERWQVCEDARFGGPCAVLRPGKYPSLASAGLNNRISSVRALGRDGAGPDNGGRFGAPAGALYDPRRRDNEALFEANVTAVRAVVGTPEQRCWVDRDQVALEPSRANLPGVIVGAVIGGILGHQVGNGRGRDLATVGGAVAGGAIGASVGRDGEPRV